MRFSVVSGQIPPALRLFTQGVGSGGITGTPTTEGLFAFTIQVQDQPGARDTESFSIRIDPPRPVVITNQSDALSPATVGQAGAPRARRASWRRVRDGYGGVVEHRNAGLPSVLTS